MVNHHRRLKIKRWLKSCSRFILRQPKPIDALHASLTKALPAMACIDVGASFGVHKSWQLFLQSPRVIWQAVEPNSEVASYLNNWNHPAKLQVCTHGLSRNGGLKTLYITNNPNGSSILPPKIPISAGARSDYKSFFEPIHEIPIETVTLLDLIKQTARELPFVLKLDTQGSELEILQGGEQLFLQGRCVGIELEASLLAEPPYEGAARFWEIDAWLESHGFELMGISPICFGSRYAQVGGSGKKAPAECDTLFTLRRDKIDQLPPSYRLALAAFHIANRYYEEAYSLIEADNETQQLIVENGGNAETILRALWRCF